MINHMGLGYTLESSFQEANVIFYCRSKGVRDVLCSQVSFVLRFAGFACCVCVVVADVVDKLNRDGHARGRGLRLSLGVGHDDEVGEEKKSRKHWLPFFSY